MTVSALRRPHVSTARRAIAAIVVLPLCGCVRGGVLDPKGPIGAADGMILMDAS